MKYLVYDNYSKVQYSSLLRDVNSCLKIKSQIKTLRLKLLL